MNWVKKIITVLVTILFATSITFFVIRAMPGDPVESMAMGMLQQGMDYKESYEKAKAMLNYDPDKPVIEQYVGYIGKLVTGDLGISITSKRPVTQIIASALPWTLFILTVSIGIAFTLGVLIGMFVSLKRNTIVDPIVSAYASISGSLPDYIVGFLLVLFLATKLRWFPGRGAYGAMVEVGMNLEFIGSVLYHACLPVLTYVVTGMGGWALAMKGSSVSVLGEDYIMAARARGLSERRIRTKYVGRNAILPLVTSLTISFGMLFGGSPLVENLFAYPGIGFYLNQAIATRDYTLMQGLFLMITIAVVVANILAEIMYSVLDPRIRTR
ncbi:MAG: ABC transporter permease [Cellulosilyticaceae bacterium]